MIAAGGAQAADGDSRKLPKSEYRIKAEFLYNIAKFVEWPANSLARDSDTLIIGVYGKSPVSDELDAIVRNHKVNGHPVAIKQIANLDDIQTVHVAFFSTLSDEQFTALRAPLKNSPVLTVEESPSFAWRGGMIAFVMVGDKVRFEINIAAAERARLKLSAQLQKLASTIRNAP